jgi:hypothetical protein
MAVNVHLFDLTFQTSSKSKNSPWHLSLWGGSGLDLVCQEFTFLDASCYSYLLIFGSHIMRERGFWRLDTGRLILIVQINLLGSRCVLDPLLLFFLSTRDEYRRISLALDKSLNLTSQIATPDLPANFLYIFTKCMDFILQIPMG